MVLVVAWGELRFPDETEEPIGATGGESRPLQASTFKVDCVRPAIDMLR